MTNEEEHSDYSHILKYTSLFGGAQGLSILVSIVRTKLIAVILNTYGVGLMSLFNSSLRMLGDATNLGIPTSAVREISEAYGADNKVVLSEKIRLVRSWSLITALMGTLLCACLAPLLDVWSFSWGNHTLHFLLLAPTVGVTTLAGCEMAIMKGCRQLRRLAIISVFNVLAALFTSVPLYFIWGETAIIPSLFVIAFTQLLLVAIYSFRHYPYSVTFSREIIRNGIAMVKLGVAFVFAGVMASGVEFIVRSYINNVGGLTDVGLYNAGFMMTITYSGMVFTALDTDYFPRLSSVTSTGSKLNDMVNKQIEVCLLIVSPMLVVFMVGLPVLIPLFYTADFMPVMGMAQATMLATYIRAIELPVAFIALSRGDSWPYLFAETVYNVLMIALVVTFYDRWGVTGAGWGIALTGLIDIVFLVLFARYMYGYKLSVNVWKYILLQIPLGIVTFFAINNTEGVAYWLSGILLAFTSTAISLYVLHSKTHLWDALTRKFRKYFRNEDR